MVLLGIPDWPGGLRPDEGAGLAGVGAEEVVDDGVADGGRTFDSGCGSPEDGRGTFPGCLRPEGFDWLIVKKDFLR